MNKAIGVWPCNNVEIMKTSMSMKVTDAGSNTGSCLYHTVVNPHSLDMRSDL